MKVCSIEGCEKVSRARGWCNMHYLRWRAHGDPNVVLEKKITGGYTAAERFYDSISEDDGCWNWGGTVMKNGYGYLHVSGKNVRAHRWSYEHHVGPIPDGLVIDHLCRNKLCVNPEHLEPVTPGENVRRGLRGILRTHCAQGHEMTEENTYMASKVGGYTQRVCRTCQRNWSREFQRAKRARDKELT